MSDDNTKYWYNLETGQVEQGYESPAIDRAGPFDTAEEAQAEAERYAGLGFPGGYPRFVNGDE